MFHSDQERKQVDDALPFGGSCVWKILKMGHVILVHVDAYETQGHVHFKMREGSRERAEKERIALAYQGLESVCVVPKCREHHSFGDDVESFQRGWHTVVGI
jgi:hypothetical protein